MEAITATDVDAVAVVELFLQHGIIPTVAQALLSFPEDAILQASACGCLAVLTQTSDVSKNEMLSMSDPSIPGLVLASLDNHREYSNLTRQVQIYACEGEFTIRIIRFSAAALREIAATSLSHSPSKTVHDKARVILDEEMSPQSTMHSTPAYPTRRERSPVSGRRRDTSPRVTSRKSDAGQKSTGRRRPKSPTNRPSTSSGIPTPGNVRSFGQLSSALGDAPGASFFTSPVKLSDTKMAAPKASRLPPPRSRDEHIQRAGEMKRRNNGNGQRDRLLLKTYGNSPLGSKTHRAGASSDAVGSLTDRGFSRENSSSRFSPLKNNYLGTDGITFVIPPPLSTSQSLEHPIVSRGTKTPTRPHSARLTPLVNERIKISTARFPDSGANYSEWGSGEDAWPIDTSMSTGNIRPQTAVVVTKLADPTSRRGRSSEQPLGHVKHSREDSTERTRGRDSLTTTHVNENPQPSSSSRSRSPVSTRNSSYISRSSSLSADEEMIDHERNDGAQSRLPPKVDSTEAMEMDQSMAELREFAQQLLKEEARISSLLAQTGSKSPGLNRMSFSDKLHKMIEIAESSMYERNLAMSSHGWGGATTQTPPRTTQTEHPALPTNTVIKQTAEEIKPPGSRKSQAAADVKSEAPKMLSSGYKKSRASSVGQKKQQTSAKSSPKADRKLASKLDPKARAPSIPFLEPLHIGPDKAPAKQDAGFLNKGQSPDRENLNVPDSILAGVEDSPQKQEDEICEESIQEDIPATLLGFESLSYDEEKEDEPVPENIDVKHDEDCYSNVDRVMPVQQLHDNAEEAPIVEEIGFASPLKCYPDVENAVAASAINVQDDTYEEDQLTFEPEESFVDISVPSAPSTVNLLLESKHFEERIEGMLKAESEAKGNCDTEQSIEQDQDIFRKSEYDEIERQTTTGSFLTGKTEFDEFSILVASTQRHPEFERELKSEGDELEPTSLSEVDRHVGQREDTGPEPDSFEIIDMPDPREDSVLVSLDWPTARGACEKIATEGILDALVEVEAMGGVYMYLPVVDCVFGDAPDESVTDAELPLTMLLTENNNKGAQAHITNTDTGKEESEDTATAPDSVLLNALQNVVNSLTPSAVLAQEILTSTIDQLGDKEHLPSGRVLQEDDFRIHRDEPVKDMAGEIGRIVASTIAGSLSSAVEQLRSLPLGTGETPEFYQSLNELVAVAVEAVAQRIRGDNDLAVGAPPPEPHSLNAPSGVPSIELLRLPDNNDSNPESLSHRSDTSRTDELHVSVQMAKAIQDSVNGIIAMSLVSIMHQFKLLKHDKTGKGPELEGEDEATVTKVVDAVDEDEDSGAILPAKAAVAVGSYVNGLIALSVQSSVERALENRSPSGTLSELTVMSVNLSETENNVLDVEVLKSSTSRSKLDKTMIDDPVDSNSQENNADEELSVETIIAISRNVNGLIALSLEKTVKQLCLRQSIGDDSFENPFDDVSTAYPQASDGTFLLPELSAVGSTDKEQEAQSSVDTYPKAAYSVLDDVSAAIRRNISAVVAVTLESVLQSLQDADEQLGHRVKDDDPLPPGNTLQLAPPRITEDRELQVSSSVDGAIDNLEERTGGVSGQDLLDEDNNSPELQDLPVAMSISIQRSVNAILMQALQNVIADLSSQSVNSSRKHSDDDALFKLDPYDGHREVNPKPYDHGAVMTAIETFDQLHLPEDTDNQASDEEANGISIQMAIAVRWTVSGMIALAVENAVAVAECMPHSAPVQSLNTSPTDSAPARESDSTQEVVGTPFEKSICTEAGDIARVISSDMAVAIRQTVDGIIERTAENVMSQMGVYPVRELMAQLVDRTELQDQLSAEIPMKALKIDDSDQASDDEETDTLPIQMSLAIRQAVNGLIGVSLQAALADILDKAPGHLSVEASAEHPDSESVAGNMVGVLREAPQVSPVSIPPLNLPLVSMREQVHISSNEEDAEEVSVMAAIAVSRTVTAVIAAGVEKMLDSMITMGNSLAIGQDFGVLSTVDENERVDISGPTSASPGTIQVLAGSMEYNANSSHEGHSKTEYDAFKESLSPAMSIAVARSVKAILMEAVDKVSQRIDLPQEYQDDAQFVKEEILGTVTTTPELSEHGQPLDHQNATVATTIVNVVNEMTAIVRGGGSCGAGGGRCVGSGV
ncbi:unnamed protein product [Phytophthora lilii]|uniref:Unnamed protein product n=1 Tax=Phytophthora lilii TaxID=2077276 RepID=A0A9W6U6A7_9STRA|nr:unnamed protein product [Phytophthora lilii]